MVRVSGWKPWIALRALLSAAMAWLAPEARLAGGFSASLWSGFWSTLGLRRGLAVGVAAAGLSIGLILAGHSLISTASTMSTIATESTGAASGIESRSGPGQKTHGGQQPGAEATENTKATDATDATGTTGTIEAIEDMEGMKAIEAMMDPVDGKVAVGFGWVRHPLYDDWRYNGGWDIVTAPDEEVRAALSGVVIDTVASGAGFPGGGRILLQHGNGLQTIYDRCGEVFVAKGEEVRQGSVIGRVDGGVEPLGPCLHFEVHRGGKPVDPGAFLRLSPQR